MSNNLQIVLAAVGTVVGAGFLVLASYGMHCFTTKGNLEHGHWRYPGYTALGLMVPAGAVGLYFLTVNVYSNFYASAGSALYHTAWSTAAVTSVLVVLCGVLEYLLFGLVSAVVAAMFWGAELDVGY